MTFRTRRWLASSAILAAAALTAGAAHAETLSADEAVRLAAKNNPSLRAALLDVTAAEQSVRAEENARVPTLGASTSGQYAESFGGGSDGYSRTDGAGVNASTAIRYTTDIGTALEGGIESNMSWRDINADPTYGADVYFMARQPLLRGGGTDTVLASLTQARSAQTQAERDRDAFASQTALDVLSAYWELWYADQAVAVQEAALSNAKKQLADTQTKLDAIGTATKLDVLQFATSAASIQDNLSQARAARSGRAIALGRLLGMTPEASLGLATIDAAPDTAAAPSTAKLKAAFAERSHELASMRAQIEAGQSKVAAADDADQPKLDVYGKVSMGGQWATDDVPGLGLPGGRPAFTVLAGLDFEVPLGESSATNNAARARTQLDATRARYQARLEGIAADVATLEVQLEAAKQQVELTQITADMARDLASAQRAKLSLGTAPSADVVKAEQTYQEAELRHLRAVVDQATKQFTLENDAGALLDRYGSMGRPARLTAERTPS